MFIIQIAEFLNRRFCNIKSGRCFQKFFHSICRFRESTVLFKYFISKHTKKLRVIIIVQIPIYKPKLFRSLSIYVVINLKKNISRSESSHIKKFINSSCGIFPRKVMFIHGFNSITIADCDSVIVPPSCNLFFIKDKAFSVSSIMVFQESDFIFKRFTFAEL